MTGSEMMCQQKRRSPSTFSGAPISVSVDISPSPSSYDAQCSAIRGTGPTAAAAAATTTTSASSTNNTQFIPKIIRSGSHTDKGYRQTNEDQHICIDDLSSYLGHPLFGSSLPTSFYAVFDGHGGSNAAATYVKDNATRLFFEDAKLPQTLSEIDNTFLETLENSHREAFLGADLALLASSECGVPASCGTTALTALVLGNHLMVANAGDSRAVLCRKGVAVPMSQDHRPSNLPERQRVEEAGDFFEYGYLNGDLAVTRALGDWYMKHPMGNSSSLTAEPQVEKIVLTEGDEFLIIACDGLWDVMSNEEAVCLVRRGLRRHGDPNQSVIELVNEALRLNTSDNVTAIVVWFTSVCHQQQPIAPQQRHRLRGCSLSEEARNRLRSLLLDIN